ncbi:Periplasmic protease [Magnetospirillum sp. LM-5]|uniref:S41 family peptidase n=1 Tax=Magnetospirillum sp. LM-5 TaxID=2681466 RepID=UPI001382E7C8|nr:S41 family peptidase [Magnetospirillum sp. LM-5]CAA7623850.1 Periplasmic protease [Magnetospirillum sp. LM-5]
MPHTSPARWFSAALLVLAGACAPVGHQKGGKSAVDFGGAERTFAFAYTAIVERHLDAVSPGAIAFEGMRGLGSIDPEIGITRDGAKVMLTASDHVVAEYPAPAESDTKGWARLTVTATLDARNLSDTLRAVDTERVYEAVFDSTLSKLDVFSRYAGAKEAREHRNSRSGFGGIGIRFDLVDGEAVVSEVVDETPAQAAGLMLDDVITHVDNERIAGLSKEEISRRLRGPVASRVTVTVRRGFKPIETSMARALIVAPTVFATLKDGVAEFRITSFNQKTAASLTAELTALRAEAGNQLKGVLLDLRGNPGGLLDQAVTVADLFIAQGPLVSTKGRHPMASQSYEARPGDIGEDLAVVVLVDGKAASAAEIVAAALQDAGRAVLIGTNSYGKGSVQTVINLPNDGEMTLTWSRFHAPSGYALHGLGVLPALCTNPAGGLARSEEALAANLAQWRATGLDDSDGRRRLRALCMAESRSEAGGDLAAAERLLGDHALMGRLLALSSPVDASILAHHPSR